MIAHKTVVRALHGILQLVLVMRLRTYFCAVVIGLFSLTTMVFAQTPPNSWTQDDRIVVGTNLITMNVSVTDKTGRYVRGLSQDQFEVYDNKIRQQIVLGERSWKRCRA